MALVFKPNFTRVISNVFNSSDFRTTFSNEVNLTLDDNSIFKKYLIININEDKVEIPVIARNTIETLIINSFTYYVSNIKKIAIPLYTNILSIEKKTFGGIINQIFTGVTFNNRIQKIFSSQGEIYYGGKGIILDEDYNPLLLCTLAATKDTNEYNANIMTYYRPICHVSPRVFAEPNKIVNKGIIKQIIPYYTNTNIYVSMVDSEFKDNFNNKVQVIVDDFNEFFAEPIKPNPATCINKELNDCLVDNIEDILQGI